MLYLTKAQKDQLIEHARAGSPNEVCGILAGKEEKIDKIYQMTNTEQSPETFFMDSQEQLKVIKEIRSQGLEMSAIYHSHPETQAYPSAQDVSLAFYPDASYVIVSLKDESDPKIRSFKIVEGKIEEEDIS